MLSSFRLGTWFGFPIKANLSFLLLLGAVFIWMGGLAGVAVALVTAGSVLLHELGHAMTARRLGVPVAGIELHFFGGAAQILDLPRTPRDEMLIAGAGPAVSFALAGIGYGLATLTGASAWALFSLINVVLGAFNLLPAFPSDGGRILRAALVRGRGLVAATDLAVKVGRVVCLALAVVGLFSGSFQLVAVAVVLWTMGTRERLSARLRGDGSDNAGAWSGGDGDPGQPVRAEYFPPNLRGPAGWAATPVAPGRDRVRPDGRVVVRVWRF
jgi:Zn-dependent protease